MERNSNVIEELNDLILINNDRIAGYEKALEEVDSADMDLVATFRNQIVIPFISKFGQTFFVCLFSRG